MLQNVNLVESLHIEQLESLTNVPSKTKDNDKKYIQIDHEVFLNLAARLHFVTAKLKNLS